MHEPSVNLHTGSLQHRTGRDSAAPASGLGRRGGDGRSAGGAVGGAAALHFCANFGLRGVYNFSPKLGRTDTVIQAQYRAADRHKANRIILASLAIGVAVAAIIFLLVKTYA